MKSFKVILFTIDFQNEQHFYCRQHYPTSNCQRTKFTGYNPRPTHLVPLQREQELVDEEEKVASDSHDDDFFADLKTKKVGKRKERKAKLQVGCFSFII